MADLSTPPEIVARRQHLIAEHERCVETGDRRGMADTAASIRILNIWFPEEGAACS